MDSGSGHLNLAINNNSDHNDSLPPANTQHPANTNPATVSDGSEPAKRGPGRPKGSTKKAMEGDPNSPPKVKRPVGRPRKDGKPAGSVPKVLRGPGRPRKNFPPDFAVTTFPHPIDGMTPDWAAVSDLC